MAQDLSAVKSNVVSQMVSLCIQAMKLYSDINEVYADYLAYGFNSAGGNALTQADLTGANAFLTPTAITNAMADLNIIVGAYSSAVLANLRQGCNTPPI